MNKEEFYKYFDDLMSSKDKSKIELFFDEGDEILTFDEQLELEIKLFSEEWHSSHEDLASWFQGYRDPRTIDVLFKTATKDFLEYDYWYDEDKGKSSSDSSPMGRKCVWALADIGTDKAKNCLIKLSKCGNSNIESFAQKRLKNWEIEKSRKGRRLVSDDYNFKLHLEEYLTSQKPLPNKGRNIIGNEFELVKTNYIEGNLVEKKDKYIVVYQAYKESIANYAVENQKLGGTDFSYKRMSWIKPSFLWMMYRCGWAEKENQERVLAIWLKKENFETILQNATFTSYQPNYFKTENEWKESLEMKKVRLQWDPDHNHLGNKLERKAIQLGLKGEILEKFGKEYIECIMDITSFVKNQKVHLNNNKFEKILIPKERIITIKNPELRNRIGIEN